MWYTADATGRTNKDRALMCQHILSTPDVLFLLQVRVASEIAHVLSLPRRQLDGFLGAVGSGLASRGQVLAALQQCRSLQVGCMTVSSHFLSCCD
jgi:hypothetical protein